MTAADNMRARAGLTLVLYALAASCPAYTAAQGTMPPNVGDSSVAFVASVGALQRALSRGVTHVVVQEHLDFRERAGSPRIPELVSTARTLSIAVRNAGNEILSSISITLAGMRCCGLSLAVASCKHAGSTTQCNKPQSHTCGPLSAFDAATCKVREQLQSETCSTSALGGACSLLRTSGAELAWRASLCTCPPR